MEKQQSSDIVVKKSLLSAQSEAFSATNHKHQTQTCSSHANSNNTFFGFLNKTEIIFRSSTQI